MRDKETNTIFGAIQGPAFATFSIWYSITHLCHFSMWISETVQIELNQFWKFKWVTKQWNLFEGSAYVQLSSACFPVLDTIIILRIYRTTVEFNAAENLPVCWFINSNDIIERKMHWNIKNARWTNGPENSTIWPKSHDHYHLHKI